ncbi:hypothetical protein [Myxococcus landrumensis]|uniref:Secreted protein n=1 Tax=Myxococcus landrumensis TaxID=2813577 RepID=A0ABX7N6R2_9BACT|nr:hypothetical protein [Myxococcus landrumus]QSQ14441.1 hypothetical protein JY572_40140 [Myxococcus landrumus]
MRINANLLGMAAVMGVLASGTASAACWSWSSGPTYENRWVAGLDNVTSGDDTSLLTDNGLLRAYFPAQCSGAYGCDVVQYSIQWFNGTWQTFTPGVNDADPAGYVRRAWAYFYDHNFQATVCN